MAVKKMRSEKKQGLSKKVLEKSELQPYDILPNFENMLIVHLLRAARQAGAPINEATIERIEESIL